MALLHRVRCHVTYHFLSFLPFLLINLFPLKIFYSVIAGKILRIKFAERTNLGSINEESPPHTRYCAYFYSILTVQPFVCMFLPLSFAVPVTSIPFSALVFFLWIITFLLSEI